MTIQAHSSALSGEVLPPAAPPAPAASRPAGSARPMSRIRFAIAVAAGVYPVITGLLYALWPLIGAWPMWEKTPALVPLMVPVMVWGVIPAAHRWLGGWLHLARAA